MEENQTPQKTENNENQNEEVSPKTKSYQSLNKNNSPKKSYQY